jgi:excisionase family DNA binding protein
MEWRDSEVLREAASMNTSTYTAIKAILGADSSLSEAQKATILHVCVKPDVEPHNRNQARPQFVSVREASEILNTSKRTVWRLARLGRIRRIKLGHRSTRFRLEDLANITSVDAEFHVQTN